MTLGQIIMLEVMKTIESIGLRMMMTTVSNRALWTTPADCQPDPPQRGNSTGFHMRKGT
ncbi:hypothetical protein PSHT_13065 [Puccinia striiformis]|uniref:Uncharacterized protein n=2 Tax=Puccinia striiformis TaxID=27350 RepID=A0A2S4UST3_9BASI|nr:hypothetical protein PSTT_16968 [Puccinia striiformis]POW00353.1 hypothetical protein PSHT_13065 [Puccinia striiformis]